MPVILLALIGLITFLIFGIAQLYAGFVGIDYFFGSGWASFAVFLALFRFTLPITIGAFFGAYYVWHWNWFLAGLFAAPGLAFTVPGVLVFVLAKIFKPFGFQQRSASKKVDLSNDPNSKTIDGSAE